MDKPARDPIFQAEHLSLAHPAGRGQTAAAILHDISLEVERGGALALIGPSGSGKSTLLRCLNRLAEPTGGIVRFNGRDIRSLDPRELRRQAALVMQTPVLFEGTVGENLRLRSVGAGDDFSDERLAASLADVGLDPAMLARDASTLSGGEKQRVTIARAILRNPEALLLDEPTSALDPPNATLVIETVSRLREARRLSIVAVTHQPDFVRRLGGTLLYLVKGRVEASASLDGSSPTLGDPRLQAFLAGEMPSAPQAPVSAPANVINLSYWQVGVALVLIAVVIVISIRQSLELERDLALGSLRTIVQLYAVGLILAAVFASARWYLVVLIVVAMTAVATQAAVSRLRKPIPGRYGIAALALTLSTAAILAYVIGVVVQVRPWYEPPYLIPLAGMILGNAMTAAALAGDRLQSDLRARADEIEAMLSLGFSGREAVQPLVRAALRAAMIPTVNGMMTVGVVQLPGMMTGQILAGSSPLVAIEYRIVVVFMLAAGTAMASLIFVRLAVGRYLTPAHQLRRYML